MSPSHHNVLVIMPAWNEAAVIAGVLQEVTGSVGAFADVLVVSDGSTDATAQIARGAGVMVLDLPINLGVGGAMRAGYLYARRMGYEYTVQLDADGQHDPAEIQSLLECARRESADVVIGARFAGKGEYAVHGPRQWAMKMLSFILSHVCGTRLTDTTSGFKLANRRAIELFVPPGGARTRLVARYGASPAGTPERPQHARHRPRTLVPAAHDRGCRRRFCGYRRRIRRGQRGQIRRGHCVLGGDDAAGQRHGTGPSGLLCGRRGRGYLRGRGT